MRVSWTNPSDELDALLAKELGVDQEPFSRDNASAIGLMVDSKKWPPQWGLRPSHTHTERWCVYDKSGVGRQGRDIITEADTPAMAIVQAFASLIRAAEADESEN